MEDAPKEGVSDGLSRYTGSAKKQSVQFRRERSEEKVWRINENETHGGGWEAADPMMGDSIGGEKIGARLKRGSQCLGVG